MPDLPTRLDYYALGRQYMVQRAIKIDPATVDVVGSDANLFCGATSVVAAAVTNQLGYAASRLYLDGNFDEDLDRYAWDRYQLVRKGASPATGIVRLYRATSAAGGGTVPAGTQLLALGGTAYVTTQPATFGSGTLDNVTCFAQAVQSGQTTQVGANQIRRFSNAASLFDPTIQVNNDAATAGGMERENDDKFKARIRSFWTTAQRGTLAAIEFGALTVPGVDSANAIEAIAMGGLPARLVNLYVADGSGTASVPMANAVTAALANYRALGIPVVVSTSIPVIEQLEFNLVFNTGVDTVTMSSLVQAAVVEFVNSLPVNGTLYVAQLFSVLQRFASEGLVPTMGSIVAPAGDVVPAVGQTIRTTPQNVLV